MTVAEIQSVGAAGVAAAAVPQRSFAHGLRLCAVYFSFYGATLVGAVAPLPLALNAAFAVANGIFIAMVFIIGHDSAHGALLPHPVWNRWMARIAFIPVLHSASLWRLTHNMQHHGRTNLKGHDPVWTPMSLAEYRAASPARRAVERVYRGAFGPFVYYHFAIWIPMLLLPVMRMARAQWKQHIVDSVIVFVGGAALIAGILAAGHALTPARSLWTVFALGWALPFVVWSYLVAVTTYLNHTHPGIPWFADEATWRAKDGHVRGTAHVKLPVDILPLYSDVMVHTAHHVNPSTPVYALTAEQARLKATRATPIQEYDLTIDEYRRIVRACKLFDFERMCWTDFAGTPTGAPLLEE